MRRRVVLTLSPHTSKQWPRQTLTGGSLTGRSPTWPLTPPLPHPPHLQPADLGAVADQARRHAALRLPQVPRQDEPVARPAAQHAAAPRQRAHARPAAAARPPRIHAPAPSLVYMSSSLPRQTLAICTAAACGRVARAGPGVASPRTCALPASAPRCPAPRPTPAFAAHTQQSKANCAAHRSLLLPSIPPPHHHHHHHHQAQLQPAVPNQHRASRRATWAPAPARAPWRTPQPGRCP